MEKFIEVEARFLYADKLIEQGEFAEAKDVLVEIIGDEPDYGRAHNHLGWLYRARLSDFARAEKHLELAVKFDPEYVAGYMNYGNLLIELGEFDKLAELADKAMNVRGIHKPSILVFMSNVAEVRGNLKEALKILEQAKTLSLDEGTLNHVNSEIRRIKSKMSTFDRISCLF